MVLLLSIYDWVVFHCIHITQLLSHWPFYLLGEFADSSKGLGSSKRTWVEEREKSQPLIVRCIWGNYLEIEGSNTKGCIFPLDILRCLGSAGGFQGQERRRGQCKISCNFGILWRKTLLPWRKGPQTNVHLPDFEPCFPRQQDFKSEGTWPFPLLWLFKYQVGLTYQTELPIFPAVIFW